MVGGIRERLFIERIEEREKKGKREKGEGKRKKPSVFDVAVGKVRGRSTSMIHLAPKKKEKGGILKSSFS